MDKTGSLFYLCAGVLVAVEAGALRLVAGAAAE
jgi:hypothetical protein